MMNILLNTPYEILIGFSIITVIVITWSFLKMKKDNPSDVCSRVVLIPLIPAAIACTLKSYCRQENVSNAIESFSSIFFWVCCAAIIITIAAAFLVSCKRRGAYYERIKSKKTLLVILGVGIIICASVVLYAMYFM